jgi:hypothetical protein
MLAQNFKTAAELGITDEELEALVKVLGMLERGEIEAAPHGVSFFHKFAWSPRLPKPKFFGMADEVAVSHCGTACCFYGWARYISGNERLFCFYEGRERDDALRALFFPSRSKAINCSDPELGAMALRNYLTTGYANWRKVVG